MQHLTDNASTNLSAVNHLTLNNITAFRFNTLCEDLMETVMRIDGNLHAELNADIQKELNLELNRAKSQKSKDTDSAKVKIKILLLF